MQYVIKPSTYPGISLNPSNVAKWVPDHSSIRQEDPFQAVVSQPLASRSDQASASKKRRTVADTQQPSSAVAAQSLTSEDDEPLMTGDEIIQMVINQGETVQSMREIGYTLTSELVAMSADDTVRHLANLAASLATALKGINDIHKYAKTRRLLASRSSPEAMWWFMEQGSDILATIQAKCPKAPKGQVTHFPGISVVQCLPRDQVEQLLERLQKAGCKALTLAHGQITHKDHKVDFISNSTVREMECLRAQCWGLRGTIENMVKGEKDRKQQR
ncbi:hypothetical protein PGT21_027914 [Puccinia graminis f. sp. tritici]|uniref:Uncharacterized protein n=1 Tax=Puccinia graminis f. sp. tritici TaxID=56615 RepID=A0A5B0PJ73_PUCGR|nr:hypothetical protein PGT21_027914 [Puccinia graminis f. sp. tritici]